MDMTLYIIICTITVIALPASLIWMFVSQGKSEKEKREVKLQQYRQKSDDDLEQLYKEKCEFAKSYGVSYQVDGGAAFKGAVNVLNKIQLEQLKKELGLMEQVLRERGLPTNYEEYQNIKAAKVKSNPNSTKDASVVGRAVAGGIIAGPVGAVVGAVSAADKNAKNRANK